MPFIPHTPTEVSDMLKAIGASDIEQLFDEIPENLRATSLDVADGLSEMEIVQLMQARARQDGEALIFAGAGAYLHHIPAAVWQIATRGEFYSAYTPYQAEASQGTLQLLYEYQTMITGLTAMDVSNASLYDGATAMAEAVLMAIRANRKSKSKKVLVARSVNPRYREVTKTIVTNQGIELVEINFDLKSGQTDLSLLKNYEDDYAAVILSQPNYFGVLEDADAITNWAHEHKMLVVGIVNPISLALLKPPGEWGENGADIVIGEGQPLGIPLSGGGPYFGFMCCKQKQVRQMPGRIIGQTVDLDRKIGYSLTLQAREQHIRRSKATSNICTNQGLMVTAATIYMSIMGNQGLQNVASSCVENTHALADMLIADEQIESQFSGDFFHEKVLHLDTLSGTELVNTLASDNILPGVDIGIDYPELGNCIMVCATEVHTQETMEQLKAKIQRVMDVRVKAPSPVTPKRV